MYSYELIKRNKAIIVTGRRINSGDSDFLRPGEAIQDPASLIKNVKPTYQGSTSYLKGYFVKDPTLNVGVEWDSNALYLQSMIAKGENFWNSLSATIEGLKSTIGGVASGKQKIGDKTIMSTLRNLEGAALSVFGQAVGKVRTPQIMEWTGARPIPINIEVIFMNEKSPILGSYIDPLLEMTSFSKLTAEGNMYGPLGYNGSSWSVVNIDRILRGEEESLASLSLYRGSKLIMNLPRILVLEDVSIEKSPQLYTDRSNEPAYKWIKATLSFKTVIPIPAPSSGKLINTGSLMGYRS